MPLPQNAQPPNSLLTGHPGVQPPPPQGQSQQSNNPVMDKFVQALGAIKTAQNGDVAPPPITTPFAAQSSPPTSSALPMLSGAPAPASPTMAMGSRLGYDDGGTVPDQGLNDWGSGTTVSRPSQPSMLSQFASGMKTANDKIYGSGDKGTDNGSDPNAQALSSQQANLATMLGNLQNRTRQGFADGGDAASDAEQDKYIRDYGIDRAVNAYGDDAPSSPVSSFTPSNDGMYSNDRNGNYNKPTPWQRFGAQLLGAASSWKDAADIANEQQKGYMADRQAQLLRDQLMGVTPNGVQTLGGKELGINQAKLALEQAINPARIAQMNASTQAQLVAADKPYQMMLATIPAMRSEAATIDNNEAMGVYSNDKAENARIASELKQRLNARYQQSNIDAVSAPRTQAGTSAAPRLSSAEVPPMPGARKAPDGNWYVADPNRPGKFLQVQ